MALEIVHHIWVSGAEIAAENALSYSAIISLGCNMSFSTCSAHLSYPSIMDSTETILLQHFQETNNFIEKHKKGNILVHCVHGQSRSVCIVAAYLIHSGYSLEDALQRIHEKHHDVCINPSFLSQLHLFAHRRCFAAEYILVLSRVHNRFLSTLRPAPVDTVRCQQCKHILANKCHILCERSHRDFLQRYTPSYWRNYRPPVREGKTRVPHLDDIITLPMQWMTDQVSATAGLCDVNTTMPLHCPQCRAQCGVFVANNLLVCHDFVLCDLYLLFRRCVRMKDKQRED